jgi:hypothetical protein
MRRRLLLPIGIATLILLSPSSALAGRFSAPVRIPTSESIWDFAINTRGEAVAVQGAGNGLRLYSLGTGSSFERAWPLEVARGYSLGTGSESVSYGDSGGVALGLSYFDSNEPISPGPHGPPRCCLDAAIASWQLGDEPSRVQELTPRLGPDDGFERAPGLPLVLVRRSSVTALWTVGGNGEPPEQGPATLREGFGSIGRPLQVHTLATVPNGIDDDILTRSAQGLPLAAWLDDDRELHVATGTANGALKRSRRAQSVRRDTNQESFGFTTDGVGDIIFWYVKAGSSGRNELFLRTSRNGGAFSRPQLLAKTPGRIWNASVLAGEGRSVLALWEWKHHEQGYLGAAFGRIGRTLVRSATVPVGQAGGAAVGFVGGSEAFVIYRRWLAGEGPGGDLNFQLKIIGDRPGRSFHRPRPFVSGLKTCGIDSAAEVYEGEVTIVTSPTGYAILDLVCDGGDEYLVRYTP